MSHDGNCNYDILTNMVYFTMNTFDYVLSYVLFIRTALVKEAANKNQDFQNALKSLNFFLINLSDNAIKPADNIAQITAKWNSQEVCRKKLF